MNARCPCGRMSVVAVAAVAIVAAIGGPADAQTGPSRPPAGAPAATMPTVTPAVATPAATTPPATTPSGALTDANYRIGPSDVLHIAVWKNEAMSRTVPVRPDGKVSIPLLNDVQAAGLTPGELRDRIAKALEEYIPSPEVSVIVTDVHSYNVSVVGEVTKPGRIELKNPVTVMDAIALAGGLKEFASRSRIVVLRNDNGAQRRIAFNYNKVFSGGEQDNFLLRPGDIVLVP